MITMSIQDIIYKIFPFIELYEKNKILSTKYNLLKDKELTLDLQEINEKEYLKELEYYEKNESKRQEIIESKAKSTLFIITLVLTLLLGSINFIYQFNNQFNNSLIIILIFGILYFIFSAITIINVLKPEEYNNLYFSESALFIIIFILEFLYIIACVICLPLLNLGCQAIKKRVINDNRTANRAKCATDT